MAVNDVFNLQVQYSVQNRKCTVNLGYKQLAGADDAEIALTLAQAWNDDNLTPFLALLSPDCKVQCIYVLRVLPAIGIPGILNLDGKIGTSTGSALPNDSPFVYKLRTTAGSSKKNGRTYISGVAGPDVTDGQLTPAFVIGAALTYGTALSATINKDADVTRTFDPVVINRVFNSLPLVPIQSSDIAAAELRVDIFSQRRRRTRDTAVG